MAASSEKVDLQKLAQIARAHPIENQVQEMYEKTLAECSELPLYQVARKLRALLFVSQKACRIIVEQDSKVRDQKEWLAALSRVENIRDEVTDTLTVLALKTV